MIKFNKPANLNGAELIDELANVGIVLDKFNQAPSIDAENNLWLDIDEKDKAKAASVISKHNGNVIPREPSIAEKLESIGLKVEDLKAALGI